MNRVTYYSSVFVLVIAFFFAILFTYWLAYPYKTIVYHNAPFPVIGGRVARGSPVPIQIEYTRYTSLPCTVVAMFINDVSYTLPAQTFQKAPGYFKGTSYSFRVPDCLPIGRYHIGVSIAYEVNPVRTIVIHTRTQDFFVD